MSDKNNFDTLLEREKRAYANAYFSEMWENAIDEGINPEILAEAMIEGALSELAMKNGASEASRLIDQLNELGKFGLFPANRTLQ